MMRDGAFRRAGASGQHYCEIRDMEDRAAAAALLGHGLILAKRESKNGRGTGPKKKEASARSGVRG